MLIHISEQCMYTLVPSAYEPPTAFLLLCPSLLSALNIFLYVCTGGLDVTCVLWSCSLNLGGLVMYLPAGLSLRWQRGCFLLSLLDNPHPLWCPTSPQPFLPSALQDIYELKDQIQDVEGRYMQGLKELKVEGLELTACLLLFSGSSMASLTLPPFPSPCLPTHTPLLPPPVAPNTYSHVFACSRSELRNDPFFFFLHDFPFTSCFDPTHGLLPETKTLPQFSWVQSCKKKS